MISVTENLILSIDNNKTFPELSSSLYFNIKHVWQTPIKQICQNKDKKLNNTILTKDKQICYRKANKNTTFLEIIK